MDSSIFYALDFDGVICDSAIETGMTGWKAAQALWSDMPSTLPNNALINDFREVRPYLETGYEAILIMRLLQQGRSSTVLCSNYQLELEQLIDNENLDIDALKQHFGKTRDQWINDDLKDWLVNNPLFSGVQAALQKLTPHNWVIITTKQERFVKHILKAYQIELHANRIFGLERQQSKQEILLQLTKQHPEKDIIFIEDRLPTLIGISENPQLKALTLQLVGWGYNTKADMDIAQQYPIEHINISQFITYSTAN